MIKSAFFQLIDTGTILDDIMKHKIIEVKNAINETPMSTLESSEFFNRKPLDLAYAIKNGTGIVAEFKIGSPSKGVIHKDADVVNVTSGYTDAGVSGISILTDSKYFFGSKEFLIQARKANPNTPILRKDFIFDEYQIIESKAIGADAILLICAVLTPEKLKNLAKKAKKLGLTVLVEFHTQEEIDTHMCNDIDIIGINNRNLKNFAENTLNPSINLIGSLPENKVRISESCIKTPEDVTYLYSLGFHGCLIGESFMRDSDPGQATKNFIKALTLN